MSDLTLVEMEACPDDVVINILGPYQDSLLVIYDKVRDTACSWAKSRELQTKTPHLVEMLRNEEGYPTAEVWCDNKCIYRLFATLKAAAAAVESKSYKSPVGYF